MDNAICVLILCISYEAAFLRKMFLRPIDLFAFMSILMCSSRQETFYVSGVLWLATTAVAAAAGDTKWLLSGVEHGPRQHEDAECIL